MSAIQCLEMMADWKTDFASSSEAVDPGRDLNQLNKIHGMMEGISFADAYVNRRVGRVLEVCTHMYLREFADIWNRRRVLTGTRPAWTTK